METAKSEIIEEIRKTPNFGEANWDSVYNKQNQVIPYQAAMLICEKLMDIVTPIDSYIPYYYVDAEGIYKPAEKRIFELLQTKIEDDSDPTLGNRVIYCIRNATLRERKELEAPVNLVCLSNGILDLYTMQIKPFDPKHFFFGRIPIVFNPNATCPNINKFLFEVVGENEAKKLKELAAYCLLRSYPIQDAFMLIGKGGNGKSTYLNLLKAFLGSENVASIPLQKLQGTFAAANLEGKLGNFCADLSDKAVEELGIFKMLTGGDPINAERKFKDAFEFTNYAKLVFSCNKPPELRDDTQGNWDRWEIVDFPNSFRDKPNEDQKLLDKLTTPEELSGLLNECLVLLPELLKRGNFTGHIGSDQIRKDYIKRSDSLGAFVMEKICYQPTQFIMKKEFYDAYCQYCVDAKMSPISENTVGKQLFSKVYQHLGAIISDGQPSLNGKQVKSWMNIWFIGKEFRVNQKQEVLLK